MSDTTPMSFPLQEHLGFEMALLEPGVATATLTAEEHHRNPHGVVHGGVLFTLVDTSMGKATTSVLGDGERCATIEIQIRFLRAVFAGGVVATTRVVHRGSRVVQLASEVVDDAGRLVATATGSFAVIPAPA